MNTAPFLSHPSTIGTVLLASLAVLVIAPLSAGASTLVSNAVTDHWTNGGTESVTGPLFLVSFDLRNNTVSTAAWPASLANATFAAALLQSTNFTRANLAGTSYPAASLSGTNLTNANLTNADFLQPPGPGLSAIFTGANLPGADPSNPDITGASQLGMTNHKLFKL